MLSYNINNTQRLLIPPLQRSRFILCFVLTTLLIQGATYLIFTQLGFNFIYEVGLIGYTIIAGMITVILLGMGQWLILNRYISDWKWILIVGIIMTVVNSIFVNLISLLISGYLEWIVLRKHVKKVWWWWIMIPLIVFILEFTIAFPIYYYSSYSSTSSLIPFSIFYYILYRMRMLLPLTKSLGLCLLEKKNIEHQSIFESPIASAPDIVNYWTVKRLEKRLYLRISRLWKTDLSPSIGQLEYLVGANRNASIIVYEPMNTVSSENVEQTSLLELASTLSFTELEPELFKGLGKFKVVFTPPGTVQVCSWQGMPLVGLIVLWYGGIFGISLLGLLLSFF